MLTKEIISMITGLSDTELRQLNSIAVGELNSRIRSKQQIAKAALCRGDKVSFTGKNGRPNIAEIVKINQKTVDVIIQSNTGYRTNAMVRVSPSMLTRI